MMAARFLQRFFHRTNLQLLNQHIPTIVAAQKSTNARTDSARKRTTSVVVENKLASSRGFLRCSYKPYSPAADVQTKIENLCKQIALPEDGRLDNLELKFEVLDCCQKEFNGHKVPSSFLHELNSIADVIKFYQTPVDTHFPIDQLKSIKLPENLHIQEEYVRFNPTDTMFGGKTAFPKSSTLVTGLKTRKQFKGHQAKHSWH